MPNRSKNKQTSSSNDGRKRTPPQKDRAEIRKKKRKKDDDEEEGMLPYAELWDRCAATSGVTLYCPGAIVVI